MNNNMVFVPKFAMMTTILTMTISTSSLFSGIGFRESVFVSAIRVPDFTTGMKSKFSMLTPRTFTKKNKKNKEEDSVLDAAYVDDKIVGWDAINNQPIYDENWNSNKQLLEKYNPGSTEREDLPSFLHVPTKEEEQDWLYKGSENEQLMKEYERRKKSRRHHQARFYKARRRNQWTRRCYRGCRRKREGRWTRV